jgi:hypothetical protein
MTLPELPEPENGMVVRFQYQWADQKQPVKDRPACIVLVRPRPDPRTDHALSAQEELKDIVYLAISTRPPRADQTGIEIPPAVCSILGLRDARCWVITSECNAQYWPNDLARIGSKSGAFHYGFMPPRFFKRVRDAFREELARRKATIQNVHYLPPRKTEARQKSRGD